jgi:hypothetical protein
MHIRPLEPGNTSSPAPPSTPQRIEMSRKKEKKWISAGRDDLVEEEEDETSFNQRRLHKENADHLITTREVPSSYLCWSVVSTLCCFFSCFRYELVAYFFWEHELYL